MIREGFMALRIVREEQSVQKRGTTLDQEIEQKQKRASRQEDGSAINFSARRASQASAESGRTRLAFHLFPKAVSCAENCVTDKTSPNSAKLIVYPDRNIGTV